MLRAQKSPPVAEEETSPLEESVETYEVQGQGPQYYKDCILSEDPFEHILPTMLSPTKKEILAPQDPPNTGSTMKGVEGVGDELQSPISYSQGW